MTRISYAIDYDAVLCPACGESYLHQQTIDVYAPSGEDANEGLHVRVNDSGVFPESLAATVHVDTSMNGNPSCRRQGFAITFTCECCCATPVMHIVQHKGRTLVTWSDV